ncbi:MAG: UDP-3-O-acyl-N-acetylglucosamine deacetylase [Gammaproteobacteria bacterium]|nr:UDP-3-O-acyl-N-acetylglucosamine deacetylase [Gammaproteobacteria bacterium]
MFVHLSLMQCTLKKPVILSGVTVHSGAVADMQLSPAPINTGVIFRVAHRGSLTHIPAHSEFVTDTRLSTTLSRGEAKISTVEHLLSAISGLGIDNLFIDVNSGEVPIMDGSAAPFVFLMREVGIKEQNAAKKFIRIKKRVEVRVGDKVASIQPYDGFKVTCEIVYDQPVISSTQQRETLDFSTTSFIDEISRARTFGLLSEYEQIRALNLARGASLENAVVVDDSRVLNEGGLRYNNEFVRHKILDAIGDLYLMGGPILGDFEGYKSGHAVNDALVKAVLADPSAWDIVRFDHDVKKHSSHSCKKSVLVAA